MIINFISNQILAHFLHRENGSFDVLSLHDVQVCVWLCRSVGVFGWVLVGVGVSVCVSFCGS